MTYSSDPGGRGNTKRVLLEAGLVLACGGLVAVAANFLSPRGLSLTRDYFPGPARIPAAGPVTNAPPVTDLAERTRDYFQARGLQVADQQQVAQLFSDPRREQELIVFVDARNEQHYAEGHVPGAYLFDHYRRDNYLPDLLPVCLTAQTIVIYCTGGNCEDSEFAAMTLRDAGVTQEKLVIYPGGLGAWQTAGLPLETGPRNSGKLRNKP
ncbi:MAG: rhodanese-like domain-containing protein [Verrucomicrobia bacterium]|nr:rhodanese-like domain-containing protein [Verrucomicrobiota bacterium]